MSVYKRGGKFWYKFRFRGQMIQESAGTRSRKIAESAELKRRYEMEFAAAGLKKADPIPLFKTAAKAWLAEKTDDKKPKTVRGYEQRLPPVLEAFGDRLCSDITAEDVREYRAKRLDKGLSNRTVNYEICALRGILKTKNLWANLFPKGLQNLEENKDAGKAVTDDDELKLIAACSASASPALLPLFLLAIDTGLREYCEQASLRLRDLELNWENGVIARGHLVVPKSKTEAGEGRFIPLTSRVCAVLTQWLSRFPEAGPNSYLFPRHSVRAQKGSVQTIICDVDLNQPMQSWYRSWTTAQKSAGLKARYRWHDLRHSFVTRLLENPKNSEQTVLDLAGHVSKVMLKRYSHIRAEAKREAIRGLEKNQPEADRVQNWVHSQDSKTM